MSSTLLLEVPVDVALLESVSMPEARTPSRSRCPRPAPSRRSSRAPRCSRRQRPPRYFRASRRGSPLRAPSCATSALSAAAAAPSLVNADKDAYAPRYVQHQQGPQRMLPTLADWAAARAAALAERGRQHPPSRSGTSTPAAAPTAVRHCSSPANMEILQSHLYNIDHQNVNYRSSRCHGG